MLSLQLKSGEYLTIGDNIVVQIFKTNSTQFQVSIQAPREVPIVRGEVGERNGSARPDSLHTRPPKKSPSDQVHDAQRFQRRAQRAESKADALHQLAALVDELPPQKRELFRDQLRRLEP